MKELTVNGAVVKAYPLTAAQRIHNYSIMFCPHRQLLNIGTGLYIQQDTDFGVLKESIKEAINRMDSMRLRFTTDENGDVYQYLVPTDDRDIRFMDFSHWKEEAAHNEMRRWTEIPFERFNSPMNEIVMIKLPDGYNGIYMKVNHLTMDSSSIINFDRDVLEIYCNKKFGTEPPKPMMSYIKQLEKDLAYDNNSEAKQRDEKAWMEQISESQPIYTDFTGPGRLISYRREKNNPDLRSAAVVSPNLEAAIAVYQLEKDPSDRIMEFCRENKVPVVCLLLMGLRTVLSKFNNNEKDVSVKSCVARRGTLLEKKSGGTRIHFFPLRTIIEPETTFMEALKIIQTEQNKIFRHADYGSIEYTYMRQKYWNDDPGASYESLSLTYQPLTLAKDTMNVPDIPYKTFWYSNGVAAQPLYLTVMHRVEDNGLNFNFEYQKAVVSKQEMEYFYYYLCRVIFRGIENKDRTVGEILEII